MTRRCTVCRRTGHLASKHQHLDLVALAALKQDGLDFMGRGFRELGEARAGGDLLDMAQAQAERAAGGDRVVESDLVAAVTGGGPLIGDFDEYAAGGDRPAGAYDDPAVQDAIRGDLIKVERHECEPSPDQIYFCRHCGADLMDVGYIPDAEPEPDEMEPVGRPIETANLPELDCTHSEYRTGADGLAYCAGCDGLRLPHYDRLPTPPWRTLLGPDEPIRVTRPGVYELTALEYHDPAVTGDWLSNSDARQLTGKGCPAQFRYDRDHGVRQTSDAFSMGHAVHSAILGKGEEIAVRPLVNPADPSQVWDSWRTNAAKAWRAEQERAGQSVILPEDAAIVEAMASAVHQKPRAHELLSQPGRPEIALFWVDQETGVQRRCLIDYLPSVTDEFGVMEPVDIKSAEEVAPNDDMERKLYNHAWHRQGTTIADGIIALGLAREVEFYFIVQSKTAPHLVTVVNLDADAERIGRIENRQALLVYKQCLETDVWPDYAEHPVTLTVPAWIARQYEEDVH